jgi:hypothetical protein
VTITTEKIITLLFVIIQFNKGNAASPIKCTGICTPLMFLLSPGSNPRSPNEKRGEFLKTNKAIHIAENVLRNPDFDIESVRNIRNAITNFLC